MNAATVSEVARPIFLRWERLRLPYNLILAAATVYWHGPILMPGPAFWIVWIVMLICAVGANLCFLAAPVVEIYLAWLGLRSRWIAPVLFTAGVAVSIPLVYLVPLMLLHP